MRRSSGSTCVVSVAGKNRRLQAHATMFAKTAKKAEHVGYVTVQTTAGEGIISGCPPGIRSKDQVQE